MTLPEFAFVWSMKFKSRFLYTWVPNYSLTTCWKREPRLRQPCQVDLTQWGRRVLKLLFYSFDPDFRLHLACYCLHDHGFEVSIKARSKGFLLLKSCFIYSIPFVFPYVFFLIFISSLKVLSNMFWSFSPLPPTSAMCTHTPSLPNQLCFFFL